MKVGSCIQVNRLMIANDFGNPLRWMVAWTTSKGSICGCDRKCG